MALAHTSRWKLLVLNTRKIIKFLMHHLIRRLIPTPRMVFTQPNCIFCTINCMTFFITKSRQVPPRDKDLVWYKCTNPGNCQSNFHLYKSKTLVLSTFKLSGQSESIFMPVRGINPNKMYRNNYCGSRSPLIGNMRKIPW